MKVALERDRDAGRTTCRLYPDAADGVPLSCDIVIASGLRKTASDRVALALALLASDYIATEFSGDTGCSPAMAAALHRLLAPRDIAIHHAGAYAPVTQKGNRRALLDDAGPCAVACRAQSTIDLTFALAAHDQFGSTLGYGAIALDSNLRLLFGDDSVANALKQLGLMVLFAEDYGINALILPFEAGDVAASIDLSALEDALAATGLKLIWAAEVLGDDITDTGGGSNAVYVRWPTGGEVGGNWGDKLNPALVHLLSGRDVRTAFHASRPEDTPIHLVIGSGLSGAGDGYTVWGSGFMFADDRIEGTPDIRAVRGPLSRARVRAQGLTCPDTLGDPAILYPLFYRPAIAPTYDVGFIRHFREMDLPAPQLPADVRLLEIDITQSLEKVVDDILSCQVILSSSLHGIIAAHSYGVPAAWVELSDRPMGDGFKFRDYWASVGYDDVQPILAGLQTDPQDLMRRPCLPRTPLDAAGLLEACPFLEDARRAGLLSQAYLIGRRPTI